MPPRRRLHGLVFALWLLSSPFFVVAQPAAVGADASYAVASTSMEPAIPQGSVVFVESVAPEAVAVGDVVTFRGEGGIGPTTTHRVVDVRARADGRYFEVAGDANPSPDNELVAASRVVGRVSAVVPLLGRFVLAVGVETVLVSLCIVPSAALVVERVHYVLSTVR